MEANEHLEAMQAALGNLQAVVEEYEDCNTIYRAAHTIKGSAAMLGFEGMRHLALLLENCFKYLRENPVKLSAKDHSDFSDGIALLEVLTRDLESGNYSDDRAVPAVEKLQPPLDALYTRIKKRAAGEEEPAAAPVAAAVKPLPPNFGPLVMEVLKHMVGLFKQPATPESRSQLDRLCQRLLQLGDGYPLWQTLIQATRRAIAHPKVPFNAIAPIVVRDVRQASDLMVAGKAQAIALGPELQRFAPPAAAAPVAATPVATPAPAPAPAPAAGAPVAANQVTIPRDPKGAARILISSFPKDQLMEIARYLAAAAR
ncbi:MAG: histidine kinase [Oscillatoriales cyanobacterium]|nr:MAG: histidine kinase [Oscillatoriales cyanobacterium]